jgi:hypothetical protein
VQYVKPDELTPPAPYLLHCGRVLASPRVRKLKCVNRHGMAAEKLTGIASDTTSPIDNRPEDVE